MSPASWIAMALVLACLALIVVLNYVLDLLRDVRAERNDYWEQLRVANEIVEQQRDLLADAMRQSKRNAAAYLDALRRVS